MINLKNELSKKRISTKDFAAFLNISEKTAFNKLNGITEFTYSEVQKISNFLFPEFKSEYLFAENNKTA